MKVILNPEQARAVVGHQRPPTLAMEIAGEVECDGCVPATARFIPAATADAHPVGEWVDVEVFATQLKGEVEQPTVMRVGRVRLGEPVPVIDPDEADSHEASYHGPECIVVAVNHRAFLGRHMEHQPAWDGALEWDDCADITHPHIDLWPDAWQPGTFAHPITERSTA